jgi:hypothetical protein
MTVCNPEQARDEMFALFLAAWNAHAPGVVGYIPDIRWQGKELSRVPDGSKHWCRVSLQTVIERQATLSEPREKGKRRYRTSGLLFVQLFSPKAKAEDNGENDGFEEGEKLANVAKKAFRGKKTKPGDVWFRNARVNPLPVEGTSYRFNMVVEYEFDEIG